MTKKIVVVNAGPRKGWNTDALLKEAARGAESAGAEVIHFDLFRLENIPAVRKTSSKDIVSAGTA